VTASKDEPSLRHRSIQIVGPLQSLKRVRSSRIQRFPRQSQGPVVSATRYLGRVLLGGKRGSAPSRCTTSTESSITASGPSPNTHLQVEAPLLEPEWIVAPTCGRYN
jgi:hypothetical protein